MLTTTRPVGRPAGSKRIAQKCMCCDRPGKIRGLCENDYQAARREVLAGNVTWAELEAEGLARPPRQLRRPYGNAFRVRFKALQAGAVVGCQLSVVSGDGHASPASEHAVK